MGLKELKKISEKSGKKSGLPENSRTVAWTLTVEWKDSRGGSCFEWAFRKGTPWEVDPRRKMLRKREVRVFLELFSQHAAHRK